MSNIYVGEDILNVEKQSLEYDGILTEDELQSVLQESTLEVKINEDLLAVDMKEFLSLEHPTRRELGVSEYATQDACEKDTLHDILDKQMLLDVDETAILWPDF